MFPVLEVMMPIVNEIQCEAQREANNRHRPATHAQYETLAARLQTHPDTAKLKLPPIVVRSRAAEEEEPGYKGVIVVSVTVQGGAVLVVLVAMINRAPRGCRPARVP
jgi:hypothetical protein